MTDRDSILRAVLESPDDDFPRFLLADWLEENGFPEAGPVIIRCQLADPTPRHGPCFSLAPFIPGVRITRSRRGLPEAIECDTDTFLREAKAVFSSDPITDVKLTDRRCAFHPNGPANLQGGWWSSDKYKTNLVFVIPNAIFDILQGGERFDHYSTCRRLYWPAPKDNAYAALSRACVAYGRKLAGLPPLENLP